MTTTAPRRRRTVTDGARKRVIEMYLANATKTKIVAAMSASRFRPPQGDRWSLRTVSRILRDAGVERAPKHTRLTPEEQARIVELGTARLDVAEISELVGRGTQAIYRVLARAGLHQPKPRVTLAEQVARNTRETEEGHRLWRGSTSAEGHPIFWNGARKRFVHQVAFELAHGPLPGDARLTNTCGRRDCVAADHWRLQGTFEEEFWRLAEHEPETGCVVWNGRVDRSGYGVFKYGSARPLLAHRVAYALEHGAVEPGSHIHHGCRNRRCVRIGHLFEGTPAEHAEMHRQESAIQQGIRSGQLRAQLEAVDGEWPGWPEDDRSVGAGKPASPETG